MKSLMLVHAIVIVVVMQLLASGCLWGTGQQTCNIDSAVAYGAQRSINPHQRWLAPAYLHRTALHSVLTPLSVIGLPLSPRPHSSGMRSMASRRALRPAMQEGRRHQVSMDFN